MDEKLQGPDLSLPQQPGGPSLENSETQPPLSPPPSSSFLKKSHLIILLGIIVVLFGGGMFMVLSQRGSQNLSSPSPTPSQSSDTKKITAIPTKKPDVSIANANLFSFDGEKILPVASIPSTLGALSLYSKIPSDTLFYAEDKKIYKYNLKTGEKKEIYTPVISEEEAIVGIGAVSSSEFYYVVGPTTYNGFEEVTLHLVNISTGNKKSFQSLKPAIYGSYVYLFYHNGADYFMTVGGDGCGGGGVLYRYQNGQKSEVSKIGFGCDTNPRYIGFLQGTPYALFASTEQKEYDPENYTYANGSLYLFNVESGSITELYDLALIPTNINMIVFDRETKQIAIVTKDAVHLFDITKREVVKKVPITVENASFSVLTRGRLFGSVYSLTGEYLMVEMDSGKLTRLPFATTPLKEGVSYVGEWDGKALLFKH